MIDFFTAPRIIAITFYLVMATWFFIRTAKKNHAFWNAIIGEDRKLDIKEIPVYYWVWLFPILFFAKLLIVILNLEIRPELLTFLEWGEAALVAIFITVIVKTKTPE